MRFYQDGSSAVEVMKKIKELRKSHRRGITLDKRQSDYDRSRGRGAFLQEFESSSDEEPELDQTITHPAEEEEEEEEEGEKEEEEVQINDVSKGAVWAIVREFIEDQTGERPEFMQDFSLSELLVWGEDKFPEVFERNLTKHVILNSPNIFGLAEGDDDTIFIESLREAEQALASMVNYQAEERKQNLSPSNEEEEEEEENLSQKLSQGLSIAESGEEEGGVGETGDSREEERAHLWEIIKHYTEDTRRDLDRPEKKQHIFLDDLLRWGSRHCARTGIDVARWSRNITHMINNSDMFHSEGNNIWLEYTLDD